MKMKYNISKLMGISKSSSKRENNFWKYSGKYNKTEQLNWGTGTEVKKKTVEFSSFYHKS